MLAKPGNLFLTCPIDHGESSYHNPEQLCKHFLSDQLPPEKAASFVESYLKAAERPRPDEELSFYADHVDYFDSGRVSRKFVAQDQASYYRRWPNREFTLVGPPQLVSSNGKRATVRFHMRYQLSNARERASGATENVVQLQQENDGFKIIGIQERKVRE